MAGAKKPEPIEIVGSDGKIYVVETWNRGTIADGDAMTEYTIKPICEAIQGGTGGLSAETERAMAAESGISAIVDNHYDEYNTFVSSVNSSAESLNAKDDDLQDQIDTLKAATDVIMVYNNYSAFSSNSGNLFLTDNDVIKVLNDGQKQEKQTYYQYSTATSAWSFIGELDPYYSKTDLNTAAGKNINISTTTSGIKISTKNDVTFSSVSALNFYIPSANDGARYNTEISSNSTGISAHIVDTSVYDEVATASWQSIIIAANNYNAYVPLSAEACMIGTDNSAYEISFSQGANNNAEYTSLAQGSNNNAYSISLAQGYKNVASSFSFAQGYLNSASNYSFAFGRKSQANQGGFAFSPFLSETSVPSFASANSFAFGIGCTADTNAFAMGNTCSAVTGGFAYGSYCSAATNSIAMGVGMVSNEKQISLGCFGTLPTQYNSKVVFHVGYGQGSAVSDRRDIFGVTYDGSIISYNSGVYPQTAEVLLNCDFFEAPRKFGRKIPMRLSQGLDMASAINVDVKTPTNFSARHNVLYGDESTGCFNMWIPYSSASPTSQEFTLTKATCISKGGTYRLTVGVDKNYSIIFRNFDPNKSVDIKHTKIKTGLNNVTGSWPNGGVENYYDYSDFFLDKDRDSASNTYFNFPAISYDSIITFIVDGVTKQFIMIKGHDD